MSQSLENTFFLAFIAYGIFLILNSKIFSFLHKIRNPYFQYFLGCPVCQGAWIGFLLSLFKILQVIHPVLDGVITSAGAYILKRLFEIQAEELKE